ncbi:MAG: SDR family oxidoreductase [Eubacteriales bacterium]|nr:SDR family oxidoreductase [Eubacteriales bacterium]
MKLVDLTGRRIVVAGASSGIGRETAFLLNQLGASVILIARREEKLKEIVEQMEGNANAYYSADLSELDSIEPLFKQIAEEQGRLDGMVYSAGISMSLSLQMFKPEKLMNIFTTNFFAFVECVRQACRKGRFNEGMRIVGVSSIASMQGDKAHLGYSASKAAMDAAVRCIAKEVADKGICINTVAPAMTETDMYLKYLQRYGEDSDSNKTVLSRQYLGIAKTNDIANTIAFLISPAARFITGITLPVDGGSTTS